MTFLRDRSEALNDSPVLSNSCIQGIAVNRDILARSSERAANQNGDHVAQRLVAEIIVCDFTIIKSDNHKV